MSEFAFVLDDVAAGVGQDNGLDAASMRAFSVDSTAPMYNGEQSSCGLKNTILMPFEDFFFKAGVAL
jgi:hypothetical protein